MTAKFKIRDAHPSEFEEIGKLVSTVYSQLPDFPKEEALPTYYEQLRNVGQMTTNSAIHLFAAVDDDNTILGVVVYFDDMQFYGSKGVASSVKNAAGFRFLAVDPKARGLGVGKALSMYCIELAKSTGQEKLIIHSTKAMAVAWEMYLKIGFKRADYLDFEGNSINVYGFEYVFDDQQA
ncbi:MAG: GNAT family N-acetyltransferase [Fulvivirga sp.]